MLPFSDRPPPASHGHGLQIRRTPAGKPLTGVITCTRIVGIETHFFGGRTSPCTRPDCKACNQSIPWRWHGYLTYLDMADHQHYLYEMTAQAAEHLVAAQDTIGSLRYVKFEARRMGSKPNGRVIIRVNPAKNTDYPLPAEPDIPAVLAHMWGLPPDAVTRGPRRQHTNNDDTKHIGNTDHLNADPQRLGDVLENRI